MKNPSRRPALRRFLFLRRRLVAALLAFLAVLALGSALAPPQADLVPVVAAARPLAAGTVLEKADLTTLHLPADSVPDAAASDPAALIGRMVGAPHSRHSPVTEASVATGEQLARPGFVVIAVPLPNDAIAPLVKPGIHIDLIDGSGEALASNVRVLAAPGSASSLGLTSTSRAALLEVEPSVATRIATAQHGGLTIALH